MIERGFIFAGRIGFVFAVALLSACTDLSAVREWAGTSMRAAQFTEIVATYADTPQRLIRYDTKGVAKWKAQAKIRAAQAKALELQLSLVADYMAALGALSSDALTDYSADVGGLTASLEKTGQVSSATVGAAGKLAASLGNAAAKLWQKRKVRDLIEQANAPLQSILKGGLRTIVNQDFRRDLRMEAVNLNLYFKGLIRRRDTSKAAKAALDEWFILRKQENARRLAAVDASVLVLDKISEGHQRLFEGRDDLGAVALVKNLFRLAKEIRQNVKEIIKS